MKILAALVALSFVGCVSKSTVTEGDRILEGHAIEIANRTLVLAESVRAVEDAAAAGEAIVTLQKDALANSKQLQANHGAAKQPTVYSPENSAKGRDQSKKEHESTDWLGIGLKALTVAASIAATLAGMPWLSQRFPSLTGAIGKWAKTSGNIITFVREKAEANGGTIDVKGILKIAKDENVLAGVQDIAKKHADQLEEKMGLEFKTKLDSPDGDQAEG